METSAAGEIAGDAASIIGAILALLTLIALIWTWTGGLKRWRAKRARQQATAEFWQRFQASWEGTPAAPGFDRSPGWPEEIVARLDVMTEGLERADRTATRAMRRGIRHEALIDWLIARVRALESVTGIAHTDPPPGPLYAEDERG